MKFEELLGLVKGVHTLDDPPPHAPRDLAAVYERLNRIWHDMRWLDGDVCVEGWTQEIGDLMQELRAVIRQHGDAVGTSALPARYDCNGRETIDRIRDALGDYAFGSFCIGTAMRYEDRAGRKGDAAEDQAKARWYRRMVAHLNGEGPDPRHERPGFVPYRRPE